MATWLVLLILLAAGVPNEAQAAKFFTVERRGAVWWLIAPDGRRFLSSGVDMVNHGAAPGQWDRKNPAYSARRSYPSVAAWGQDTVARLRRWGFNTLGAWGDKELYAESGMPFTVCLHLGLSSGMPWGDLWNPALEEQLNASARESTAPWRDHGNLIGYFSDNEMSWWDESLFAYHLSRPWRTRKEGGGEWVENLTKLRLVKIMEREYAGSLRNLKRDWVIPEYREFTVKDQDGKATPQRVRQRISSLRDLRGPVALRRRLGRRPRVVDLFMRDLYERYGELMYRAIKGADPDHLLLGERYYQFYMPDQVRVAGKWNDVVSTNRGAVVLDGWISPNHMAALERLSGRPAMVGEFYFAAMENNSGNRNTQGGFPTVPTQRERAHGYAAQLRQMAGMPFLVGWHWFQYFDEATLGRGDGEDYNMGLVDIHNEEYPGMIAASIRANRAADGIHAQARRSPPHVAGVAPEFTVPRARKVPNLDGDLRDWDKPASWVPGLGGRPYGVPFGDLYLSSGSGKLYIALQYQRPYWDQNFVVERAPGASWPEAEGERFTIALARPDGSQIRRFTWVVYPDDPGWNLTTNGGGAGVDWNRTGQVLEVAIPVSGEEVRLAALLRSRGDGQLIYFGAWPLHENSDPEGWGCLTLR